MKFTTQEVLAAPIDRVFAELSDFPRFEREAMERGAQVDRRDRLGQPGTGMKWHVEFAARGTARKADATLTRFDPPRAMRFEGRIGGMQADMDVSLTAEGPSQTRVEITTDLSPRSLGARVTIQSMKLARQQINKRYRKRIRKFLRATERSLAA